MTAQDFGPHLALGVLEPRHLAVRGDSLPWPRPLDGGRLPASEGSGSNSTVCTDPAGGPRLGGGGEGVPLTRHEPQGRPYVPAG